MISRVTRTVITPLLVVIDWQGVK